MEHFILQLGMMSLQASVVICVVLLVRLLFVQLRVPKKYMCILWMLPYLCMICPWKFESSFGFWRMPEQVEAVQVQEALGFLTGSDGQNDGDQYVQNIEEIQAENLGSAANMEQGAMAGGLAGDAVAQNVVSDNSNIAAINGGTDSATDLHAISLTLNILYYIWLAGITVVLAYSTISYLKLRRKLICSVRVEENIYIADDIAVPFVLGIFKPRIYLPSDLPQESLEYVVTHERTHIRRRDPLKKIMTLGISALHWFNPLAWVVFHFLEKDMEMACDEETIQKLGLEHKKDYAEALLTLSSGKKLFLGAPLAFDEGNVKGRICNILKYKKVWRAVTGFAVVLIAVLAVCFMTRSTDGESNKKEQQGESDESAQAGSENVAANSTEATESEEVAANSTETMGNESGEQPEATARCLGEYLIDFTRDGINEKIVFEVNAAGTEALTDAEIQELVWAGELSLEVRILEGEDSGTSGEDKNGEDGSSAEATFGKVLWEASYSGKYEENGNLAVCEYLSKPCMLVRYNNEVTDGTGRFWYEVLTFENSEASVLAANEAIYDVVNVQEMEGQELTPEYLAMVEQVQLVEEELEKYVSTVGISRILMNVVSEPAACYLYQADAVSGDESDSPKNEFEVFALQAEGTGAEWKIEDFFYPKNPEGITVLQEDARERVLAGEVLYLDVTEENDTAGNIDLDGDGQKERIYLEALEGYSKYGQYFWSSGDYRLRVNNIYYQDWGHNIDSRVMLYSPNGETILMAIYDRGPSADPLTTFYRYDAESNQILWAGEMACDLESTTIEAGVIKGSFRADMIETQFAVGYWIWDGENIVLREDEVYEFSLYSERYGENGEVYKDGYMKLKEPLTVYAERDENSTSAVMQPQMVLCTSSDLKEWIYLVAEDGTEGWLRVEKYGEIPSLGNKESWEVFDGLGFAG